MAHALAACEELGPERSMMIRYEDLMLETRATLERVCDFLGESFAFIDLRFRYPENAAVFATYFDETEMLDLGANGPDPLTLHCHLPMSVTR